MTPIAYVIGDATQPTGDRLRHRRRHAAYRGPVDRARVQRRRALGRHRGIEITGEVESRSGRDVTYQIRMSTPEDGLSRVWRNAPGPVLVTTTHEALNDEAYTIVAPITNTLYEPLIRAVLQWVAEGAL